MKTELISSEAPDCIERALAVLNAGGLVVFPTDTVYGVGAPVDAEESIERLYTAKGREETKAIPVLLGDVAQLDRVATGLTESARRLAGRYWPGPLTLIVSRRPDLPKALSPYPTVGVRIPDHALARRLLRSAGPLATTSANRSGQPSPVTAQEALAQLDGRVELIIDGGRTPGGVPSTVVDCSGPELKILRAGPLTAEQIRAAGAGE